MLETIYEVDENILFDNDSQKFIPRQHRLPYYICWSIITACFLIITFSIPFSLYSINLPNHSIDENTGVTYNIPITPDHKLELSTKIIDHLGVFSHEIHKQLNLQPDTITYLVSSTSNSVLVDQNQSDLLWVYSHLKYPQHCINNILCKENYNLKLEKSFTKLSKYLSTLELDSYPDKQIQLDWCTLIDNSTTATLVSLLSLQNINQSDTEITMSLDQLICDKVDENVFLSDMIDNSVQHKEFITTTPISIIINNQVLAKKIDFNNNSIEKEDEEINKVCTNPGDCQKLNDDTNHQYKEASHYQNDIGTPFLII